MPQTYWIADLHIGHANIIHFAKRPFKDVNEMDAVLIRNWVTLVQPDDVVYCLGDFIMGTKDPSTYLNRLTGHIHLILGNHDSSKRVALMRAHHRIASISTYAEISINGQRIVMMHYPLLVWNKSHHGSWSLHGHCHGNLRDDPNALRLDVGVDCWDYAPVSIHQLKARMAKKTFKPVDHHGASDSSGD